MKKFPQELLHPQSGRLDAVIFKNTYLDIPETLFYSIQIDLNEFKFDDELIETSIVLDFIRFDIYKLKELETRVFEFPLNPIDGYIDGSIYLFNVHNPVDVNKIEFSKFTKGSIEATFHYNIDFEFENTGYAKNNDWKLKVTLLLGELSIARDIISPEDYNPTDSKKLASRFISLEEYEDPALNERQVIFKMVH